MELKLTLTDPWNAVAFQETSSMQFLDINLLLLHKLDVIASWVNMVLAGLPDRPGIRGGGHFGTE